MSVENHQAELFDRYLEKRLTLGETKAFEERLKQDPDFKEAFRLHKEIDFAILEDDLVAFKQELDNIHSESGIDWDENAPMLIDSDEHDDVELAIKEKDILGLRMQLSQIHEEFDSSVNEETAAEYLGIDWAVKNQDSNGLHSELQKFNDMRGFVNSSSASEQTQLEKEIDQAISESNVIDFRIKTSQIANEVQPSVKTVSLQSKLVQIASIAAVILILVGSGIIFGPDKSNADRLLKGSSFDFAGPGDPRGATAETRSFQLQSAYQEYQSGDYKTAAKLYNFIEGAGLGVPESWMYYGISLYETERLDEAEKYFSKVLINDDNCYDEVAEWYLIGCLVKKNEIQEAQARLNKIVIQAGKHNYKDQAAKLLKQIRRMK
ncbi:MAG: tetratricopeptide repeat protein [Bacteroidetes bacterium]|jgi:TolA-binding protein|nr:tetratricopeptide repeat protein [Bacteroidota bacterium]MBT3749212.1 tetratricopeptide repeat protein [Bacteroidota bacterium]MBT4400858.1 tetratricopeptide repeat protein [Bacteroidota bacterium]MBT4410630.1 tetratricopeptide repeat protein [Bacteroidota bacterium]MBT5428021.1 tetratricopeptide repeat protein [Bacteroidota bacterium]